jgi:hypothetical protein
LTTGRYERTDPTSDLPARPDIAEQMAEKRGAASRPPLFELDAEGPYYFFFFGFCLQVSGTLSVNCLPFWYVTVSVVVQSFFEHLAVR